MIEPITIVDFDDQALLSEASIRRAIEESRHVADQRRARRAAALRAVGLGLGAALLVLFGACVAVAAG